MWLTIVPFSGFFLNLISYAVLLSYYLGEGGSITAEAVRRLNSLSRLIAIVAGAVLLACITELAAGAKRAALTQATSKVFRIVIYVLVVLVSVLMLVYYIFEQYQLSVIFGSWSARPPYIAFGIIGLVALILLLVGALAVFIFALVQRHATRKHAGGIYASVGGSIAAIAALNFLLYLWGLAVDLATGFGLPDDPNGLAIADAIVGRWGTFIVLFLIYRLGNKSTNGLWSTLPPKHEPSQPTVGHV